MRIEPRITLVNLTILLLTVTSQAQQKKLEARKHWWDLAQNDLAAALNVRDNWNVAKNVIMFLGDGLGITVNTASRIFKGQKLNMNGEEGYLAWERFPATGLLKTYNVDKQVPDSAATATAYLCGVKTNYYTLGVDSEVNLSNCTASKNPIYHTPSILQWAQEAGKDTGFVTTTRVTHATPAALYAHSANRRWECDGNLGEAGLGCKDIADQLITDNPGRNIKVILGGGRHAFGAGLDPVLSSACTRRDGRDLTKEWFNDKTQQGFSARYVTNAEELASADPQNTDYLMGLFADSHVPYEVERQEGTPSLAEMTLKALKILKKNKSGFFLLVEGGRIDHALHDNKAQRAFEETVAMDAAVNAALMEIDLEDTLMVVTADHSHVMTINGYPDRGNDILGMTGELSRVDLKPYTTIMFTNGPGYNFTTDGTNVMRQDPRTQDLHHVDYRSHTAVPMPNLKETHGGEDVAVWAAGPMSHLFHRTHEQHYVAHVMAYAACVGPSQGEKCERPAHATITKGPKPPQPPPAAVATASAVSVGPAIASAVSSVGSSASAEAIAGPKFPTLSPILQQLIDTNEKQIVDALGTQSVSTFTDSNDVRRLLGQIVQVPHSD